MSEERATPRAPWASLRILRATLLSVVLGAMLAPCMSWAEGSVPAERPPAVAVTKVEAAAQSCGVDEADLVDSWRVRGEGGFFETFRLAIESGERTFGSWLHERPDTSGTWTYAACRLVIVPRDGSGEPFVYDVLGLRDGRLRLRDTDDARVVAYGRIKE